ncbi:MAG: AAA family ATPase [Methanobrevibacter arboriphilus]|uniref:AAA family ATPase n=1 Tax=Methanobrevibacter arboriphilus TaxID=39441 RepID=A0A843AFJ9_METAZ|nr:AAA family ATPase [Methanobrevibacter arboriphilus]MBF4467866.1 AAA family ATPase [Methanobrevibacter arboriphilus]
MNITIYYGPKKGFLKILPEEYKTLSEFIIQYDSKKRQHSFKDPNNEDIDDDEIKKTNIPCLVADSESYSGITESAVQSFVNLLVEYEIDDFYLQNPPIQISNQLKQSFPDNIQYEKFKYNKIGGDEFLKFHDEFEGRIIGQKKVKKNILSSLYHFIKKNHDKKPIILMFYGASGIGKTETAKFISEVLNGELFRKQFSMFQNEKFGQYLFGGKHAQSSFAKDLLDRESNVILMDEFDKAPSIFHEAFYQLFDDGIFEDKNYKVELYNTIIICTSNYQNENEIRKNIGDPLFFRFSKFIKFENLNIISIKKIIKNNLNNSYEKLSVEEKKKVDYDEILKVMLGNAYKLSNARQISNIINECIDEMLVESFILENRD